MDAQTFWNVIGQYNQNTIVIQTVLLILIAISLLKEYRHHGIGAEQMKKMLVELKSCGYKQASLSVQ